MAILSARPVVNDIKKIHAALAAGTPTEIKIGRTIEPTMMMDPKPESVVKRTATAIDIIKVLPGLIATRLCTFLDDRLGNTSLFIS